jgi:hypothetical protein
MNTAPGANETGRVIFDKECKLTVVSCIEYGKKDLTTISTSGRMAMGKIQDHSVWTKSIQVSQSPILKIKFNYKTSSH